MGTPDKHIYKIVTVLCFLLLHLTGLFFCTGTVSADTLPTEEVINRLAENSKLAADAFMQQSFKLRMQYEYNGRFLTGDSKENLHKLAKNTSDKLQTIIEKQQTLKQQIEGYQGDDWDQRYGSTGLWRKLSADNYITKLNKYEIDYYLALTSEQPQKNEILHKILARLNSSFPDTLSNTVKLLKIKTLILLAETESDYITQAKYALYSPDIIHPDTHYEFDISKQIQKIKFSDKIDPDEVNKLTDYFFKTDCADDSELVLSLAILQIKSNQLEAFEKTASLWPQTENVIGSLILEDLTNSISQEHTTERALEQISVFEAELAAQFIWKNETENYQKLLNHLSSIEKFQTPLILYVTATKMAESSPSEVVHLLVKASELRQRQKNSKLNIDSCKIAEQAAQLAYNLFITDPSNCPLAIETFEKYCAIAGEKIDEELEYLYTVILNTCSRNTKAKEILEKIAGRPAGKWRNRARLDLILQSMQKAQNSTRQWQSEPLEKLGDFILSCNGSDENSNKLRREAINIYCQTALESGDNSPAEKMLEILAKTKTTAGINLDLLNAQVLQRLGKLDESAHYMLLAVQNDSGSLAGAVKQLLAEIIDNFEEFSTEPSNPYSIRMIENCKELAQFCYSSLKDRQSALFLAEISVLAANKNKEKLLEADKFLNNLAADDDDVDLLRCRARLFSEQAEFEKAAPLWAAIAKMQKNNSPQTNQQSWKWWRAKFYELYCWSKYPQTEKKDVLHTIEVLENSFTDIPPIWAKKLNSLKRLCRSNFSEGK